MKTIALLLAAVRVGCGAVAGGAPAPSRTPNATPPPDIRPFPSATAPIAPLAPTSTPTTTSREIPLRRSDGDAARRDDGQTLYRLVEEGEAFGDVVADHLAGDEMMCVRHLDLSPVRCTCWIGPLENAGVRGGGLHGMRRMVILSGGAEEAALALIEDWNADIGSAGDTEACTGDHLSISHDGGVFSPQP